MATKKGRSLNKVVWPSASSGPGTRSIPKVGRNEPCPCGSGKKYKDCHQKAGDAYLQKLARRSEKEKLTALRAELKERGVPWYKRLFYRG
jgi:hypothetical protein